MNISPYDFGDCERLRFGKYPVLDTVFYRWARRIEETLFEQVRVEVYAGASTVEEMKFASFYATLRHARPMYFFSMAPFHGTGLFMVDNRFSAFCLTQQGGRSGGEDGGKLNRENQRRLQGVVQALLKDFDACWADLHEVQTHLTKVTTYPFRARILNPYEPCLVAQVHLSGRNLSARLTWCLPRTLLEPVLPKLQNVTVIPPLGMERRPGDRLDPSLLMEKLHFGVQVTMGQVDLGSSPGGIGVGDVLPLKGGTTDDAVISLEGHPSLTAAVGRVEGQYAVKVQGRYPPPQPSRRIDPSKFQPMQWPASKAE